MSLILADDKSTWVQVMAWCSQATSHYLSQCWPRSMLPNGITITRPQWVKTRQCMIDTSMTYSKVTVTPLLMNWSYCSPGVGVTKPIFSVPLFSQFSEWSKQWLPVWYHVHIWQVSAQLSCGDTWQIWTWLKVSDLYFSQITISCNGEINEWSFSNPHPCTKPSAWQPVYNTMNGKVEQASYFTPKRLHYGWYGLVQDCIIASALAMEILQSWTKP